MSQIIRNTGAYPGMAPGLRIFAQKVINSDGSHNNTYTFETKCITILFAVAISSAGTQSIPTESASTLYPGTVKVVVTVPLSASSRFVVIGLSEDLADDVETITDNTVNTIID